MRSIYTAQKSAADLRTLLFDRAKDILMDPERVKNIPDDVILRLAAQWGLRIDANAQDRAPAGRDNTVILVHSIPEPPQISANLQRLNTVKEIVPPDDVPALRAQARAQAEEWAERQREIERQEAERAHIYNVSPGDDDSAIEDADIVDGGDADNQYIVDRPVAESLDD